MGIFKRNIKPYSVIKVKKEHHAKLEKLVGQCVDAEIAFEHATKWIKYSKENLNNYLENNYRGLNGYYHSYIHKTHIVNVAGVRRKRN